MPAAPAHNSMTTAAVIHPCFMTIPSVMVSCYRARPPADRAKHHKKLPVTLK